MVDIYEIYKVIRWSSLQNKTDNCIAFLKIRMKKIIWFGKDDAKDYWME